MKPYLYVTLALAIAAGPFMLAGCGDDKKSTTDPQDTTLTEEELATASGIATSFGSIFQIGIAAESAIRNALHPARAPQLDAASSCPNVQIDGIGPGHVELTLDYGTGCTTQDGTTASGAMHAAYRAGTPADTIRVLFDAFTIDDAAVEGLFTGIGSGTVWTIYFDGTLTNGSSSADLVATLGLAVDLRGTPTNPSDDVETITGSGTYTENAQTYLVAITQPLILGPDCAYPTSGVLTYQIQSDHPGPLTTVDFSAGECCTVLVTIGTRSQEMNLCSNP